MNHPADENSQERPEEIDPNIAQRGGARGDKRLVVFIRRGKQERRQKGDRRLRPKTIEPTAQSAKKQPGENRIFGYVRDLAHEEVHLRDRDQRNVRIEPEEQRSQKPRGVLGRHQIRGTENHHSDPEHDR